MASYGIDWATGNVVACSHPTARGLCGEQPCYSSWGEAESVRDSRWEYLTSPYGGAKNYLVSPTFDEKLLAAAHNGFSEAPPGTAWARAQVALLTDPTAIGYHLEVAAAGTLSPQERFHAAVLAAWGIHRSEAPGEELRYHRQEASRLLQAWDSVAAQDFAAIHLGEQRLRRGAAALWAHTTSPFNDYCRALLYLQGRELGDGYRPSREEHYSILDPRDYFPLLGVRAEDLLPAVVAYDVETDTSRGYGLRPPVAQITEVVVATKEVAFVMAGDEAFVLQKFADTLQEVLTPSSLLTGWNNHNYDDIALQCRAQLRGIASWRGRLQRAATQPHRPPVGATGHQYALSWRLPSGEEVVSTDSHRDLIEKTAGSYSSYGLKNYVESLGCSPLRVDCSHLHELSEARRRAYVLSDGISTLRAHCEVARLTP